MEMERARSSRLQIQQEDSDGFDFRWLQRKDAWLGSHVTNPLLITSQFDSYYSTRTGSCVFAAACPAGTAASGFTDRPFPFLPRVTRT